jgi:hypothetical protein
MTQQKIKYCYSIMTDNLEQIATSGDENEIKEVEHKEPDEITELKKKLQEKEKKENERKLKLSVARKKTAQTKIKGLNILKKKGELFDKYLNNELTYEDVLKNGFEFKEKQKTEEKTLPKKEVSRTDYFLSMLR